MPTKVAGAFFGWPGLLRCPGARGIYPTRAGSDASLLTFPLVSIFNAQINDSEHPTPSSETSAFAKRDGNPKKMRTQ